LYEDGQPGEVFITMAKEGSTVGGLMDAIGTCTSMALQYGVPLITLVDKFRHAKFDPSGMTSNKNIPFAKSIIDYIFCWLGCQFLPGYVEKNFPNQAAAARTADNKNVTTAKQLVEKTKDLAQKIAEAKSETKSEEKAEAKTKAETASQKKDFSTEKPITKQLPSTSTDIFTNPIDRLGALLGSNAVEASGSSQPKTTTNASAAEKVGLLETETKVMQQFSTQFRHFQDDAPACDICGAITVRNGTCYKCFNCGNSMGCS